MILRLAFDPYLLCIDQQLTMVNAHRTSYQQAALSVQMNHTTALLMVNAAALTKFAVRVDVKDNASTASKVRAICI